MLRRFLICLVVLLTGLSLPFQGTANSKLRASIDSLQQALKVVSDDSTRVRINLKLSNRYGNFSTDTMYNYIQEAYRIATQKRDGKGVNFNNLGFVYQMKGWYFDAQLENADSALFYLRLAEQAFQTVGNNRELAVAYTTIGTVFFDLGQLDSASQYFVKSLDINRQGGYRVDEAVCYSQLGRIERRRGNFVEAKDYLMKAAAVQEELKNWSSLGYTYTVLGGLHIRNQDFDVAIDYYNKSIEIYDRSGNQIRKAYNLSNLGAIQCELGQYDESIENLKQAVDILKQGTQQKTPLGNALANLGGAYLQVNNYNKAKLYFDDAMKIGEELQNKGLLAMTKGNMAFLYMRLEEYDQAIATAESGLELGKDYLGITNQMEFYGVLAKAYSKGGDYKSAYKYQELELLMRDSLYSTEKNEAIAELDAKYQAERQSEEIEKQQLFIDQQEIRAKRQEEQRRALIIGVVFMLTFSVVVFMNFRSKQKANRELKLKNDLISSQKEELQTQSEQLEETNKGKDKLFSIISHDLRGPLSTLQGMLELAEQDKLNSKQLNEMLANLSSNFSYTNELLDNLLLWSRSQLEGIVVKAETFDLRELVENKRSLFSKTIGGKQIGLTNKIQHGTFAYADRNMIDLVFRNLLSNAIKFTEEGGKIDVSGEEKDGLHQVCIADNGVGMPVKKLELILSGKYFTTVGANHEKGTGLGLLICRDFVEKNGGKIWVESKMNEGTMMYFTIPMKPKA